ncbi:MAG: NAD-dependent DNA ligase LigA [Puniceicoccales bacterium]|jgi:DNA ligase (NAD+)|nr:NAD-dependent DNA ligase LigA [Puniceicoccales bacterium]
MSTLLNSSFLRAKYEKLLAEINLHDRLYYREHSPKISDFEYDCIRAEAERIRRLLEIFGENARDIAIGDDRSGGFASFAHLSPMMSLANTYSRGEVLRFSDRLVAALGDQKFSFVVEPKIDGIAINLIYRNGNFSRALTRGNGTVGDDVTGAIGTVKNLPLSIENDADAIEIRGEIYIDGETFEAVNRTREENGLEPFANPRNLAAGTVKTLDTAEIASRNLKIIAYAIGHCSENTVGLQSEALEYLKRLGFPSQEKYWIAGDIDDAWKCVEELGSMRAEFPYWTDGAVLKVNELKFYGTLGATAKSPRWAIAYKFAPERAVTRLMDITLQVGRTGVITPVAELETVQLSGTNVSRATLHNADEIANRDIRIGDFVTVEKAGEIIPAIVAVEMERRPADSKRFIFPETCPACGSKLVRLSGEVAWRCQNSCCLPQIKRRMEHFVSRDAMDIDGFGTSVIEKLMAANKLNSIGDIYRLNFADFDGLENFGEKSTLKILNAIDGSRTRPLWRLLHGLGIFGIGEQTAKVLAKKFPSIGALMAADPATLENLNGIGEKLSASVVSFFREPGNRKIVEDLRALGVNPKKDQRQMHGETAAQFSGKIFAITGTLASMPRQRAIEIIEDFGGHVSDSVSKNTHVLVAGEGGGSKLDRAKNLGVSIWNEEEFLKNSEDARHLA